MDSPARVATPETRNGLLAQFDRLHLPDFGKVGKFASMVGVATAFAVAGIGKAQAREQMPYKAKVGAEIGAVNNSFESAVDSKFSPLRNLILARSTDRSTVDRPDDKTGEQVHVAYVLPSDGRDRQLDSNNLGGKSSIEWSVGAMEAWIYARTNRDTVIRFDTYNNGKNLDVTAVTCGKSNVEITGGGSISAIANLESCLRQAGLNGGNKKYLIYYDGNNANFCGKSSEYGHALILKPSSPTGCRADFIGKQPTLSAGRFELLGANGTFNVIGIQFVNDSSKDLMYLVGNSAGYNNAPPNEVELDVDGKNYMPQLKSIPYMEGPVYITVTGGKGGKVNVGPDADNCTSSCTAWEQMGKDIGVKAIPDAGWQLKSIIGGGISSDYSFKMDGKKSVQVTFVEKTVPPPPEKVTLDARVASGTKFGSMLFKGKKSDLLKYQATKKDEVVAIRLVRDVKGGYLKSEKGCENKELKKKLATTLGWCYVKLDGMRSGKPTKTENVRFNFAYKPEV